MKGIGSILQASRTRNNAFLATHRLGAIQRGIGGQVRSSPDRGFTQESQSQLPAACDVTVIGGGIMGCFTLYHLARLGCTPVLLERHKLTCGTTWHTNGLVWRLRPGEVDTLLLNATRNMVLELELEEPAGWTPNGGLFIASNKTRLEEYARLYTIGRTLGVECHLLTPKEVQDSWPLLHVDDVTGALYSPGDGGLDPATLCATLVRKACMMGAKVLEGVEVTGLDLSEGPFGGQKVYGVKTPRGTMRTEAVVNCTGVWCNDLLQESSKGQDALPQVSMEHSIVVMASLPGARNMPNVRDHDANMCFRVQGESLVIGGYELNAHTCQVDRDFSFGLYDLKMDNFLDIMAGAVHRVPKLAETGIKAELCGPESFTPDRKPILGEDWEIRGLYHGFGFNSSGIMLSGGCSEQLAHWIVHGRPLIDMAAFDCRRFPKECKTWRSWAVERSHESYTSNYNIVFPHNQPLAGRLAITSPLHQKLTDSGCFWEETLCWERSGFFHKSPKSPSPSPLKPYDWKGAFGKETHEEYPYRDILRQGHTFGLPAYYEQIETEYLSMTSTAAIVDQSSSGRIGLSGRDVDQAVDWLFLKEVKREGPGALTSSVVLNKRAGIEAQLTVFRLDKEARLPGEETTEYLLQCGSGTGPYVRRLLRDMCRDKGLEVDLESLSHQLSCLLVIGPASQTIFQSGGMTQTDIPINSHTICEVNRTPVRLSRYANDTFEIHVATSSLCMVYDYLMTNGRSLGLTNAGYRALGVLHLELGTPTWHTDIRSDDTPLEAGIWSLNDITEPHRDFIGKDALLCQATNGTAKTRVCLEAPNCPPLWGNEGIVLNGHLTGLIRRADHSFFKNSPVTIGYVQHPTLPVGTASQYLQDGDWQIERQGERYHARLFQPQTT